MSLKQHTIIFVPHARARFRKFRITNRQLAILATALFLLTTASVFTTWTFFTNTIDRNELAAVRSENDQLRKVNQSFENSIRTLEGQLTTFEERTRKLAIVAGLATLGEESAVGIGGESLYTGVGEPQSLGTLQTRADTLSRDLESVQTGLESTLHRTRSTPSVAPVRGILTSRFGRRLDPVTRKPTSHAGIDIATAPGRPVSVTANGVVVRAGRIGGLGNAVYVSHGYGLVTRYGHMSSIAVQPGQRLEQGDTVGYVGSTGKSTGYHLHYEVLKNGRAENPEIYILDRAKRGI